MGHIYLRGKMWWCNYSSHGKRVRHPLSPNKRQAEQMQEELLAAHRTKRIGLIPSKMSLEVFERLYLRLRKEDRRPNTYAHDDLAFRRVREAFPALHFISEITPELLLEARLKWKEKGYGDSAIGSYVMRIKVAMKTAELWRYVGLQPWHMVKDYVSSGSIIYYTIPQLSILISKTSGVWKTAAFLMGRAGLRTGEVIHLEWDDIDFKEHLIYIRAKSFWKPKGWKPRKPHERQIDMPKDLEDHLRLLPQHPGFVLGTSRPNEGQYAKYFKNLITKAGLRGSAHAFRHTYASHLISNGATLEEVGELLGHTNPVTTKIYAHLMPHARKRAVSRLPPLVADL